MIHDLYLLLSQDISKIPQESLPAATTPPPPNVGGAELSKFHILATGNLSHYALFWIVVAT